MTSNNKDECNISEDEISVVVLAAVVRLFENESYITVVQSQS